MCIELTRGVLIEIIIKNFVRGQKCRCFVLNFKIILYLHGVNC